MSERRSGIQSTRPRAHSADLPGPGAASRAERALGRRRTEPGDRRLLWHGRAASPRGGARSKAGRAAWLLLALALTAAAACGGGASEPPPPTEPLTADQAEIAAYLSERTMELWVVYNRYDLEGLRAFYEERYWLEQEEELRRNMAPFESRGTTFTAEETSPPRETEPGKWELTHTTRFGGGSLNMRFIYEQFDGEWLLTHAELD